MRRCRHDESDDLGPGPSGAGLFTDSQPAVTHPRDICPGRLTERIPPCACWCALARARPTDSGHEREVTHPRGGGQSPSRDQCLGLLLPS